MADNRLKLTAGLLKMPEAQRQDLARMGEEYKRFQEADYLRKMGEQGMGLAKSVARGVPQMATGLVDLASLPFEAAGVIQPGQAVGSTKWLESKGYLPEQQEGFLNQTAELLSGGFDPSDLVTKGAPLLMGIGKTVWHGSPHTFDKFDLSKIGTGEGAQAYGHGLYLAESPDVAKGYQSSLSADRGFSFEGKSGLTRAQVQDLVNEKFGTGYLDNVLRPSGVADSFIDDMVTGLSRPEGSYPRQYKPGSERAKMYDELRGKIIHTDPGSLYKVDLPDEQIAKMLDYDLPIANQPEQVKQSLLQLNDPHINQALSTSPVYNESGDYWSYMGNTYGSKNEALQDVTPMQLISGQRGSFKSPQEASQRFYEAGIPGIQYLDQASRGAGEGTRNYVVFSDEIPQILERNNQPVAQALREYKPTEMPISDLKLNEYGEAIAKSNIGRDKNFVSQNKNPISVVRLPSGEPYVLDGYHRLELAKRAGQENIQVKELPLTEDIKQMLINDKIIGQE